MVLSLSFQGFISVKLHSEMDQRSHDSWTVKIHCNKLQAPSKSLFSYARWSFSLLCLFFNHSCCLFNWYHGIFYFFMYADQLASWANRLTATLSYGALFLCSNNEHYHPVTNTNCNCLYFWVKTKLFSVLNWRYLLVYSFIHSFIIYVSFIFLSGIIKGCTSLEQDICKNNKFGCCLNL